MKYDFDRIVDRENDNSYKYGMRQDYFGRRDVIPMWVADTDFEVAPFIREAIQARASHLIYGYDYTGPGFAGSLAAWLDRRNGWQIDTGWVVPTPGVVSGIVFSLLAFSRPGDGVVIQPPVYPPFAGSIAENGRKVVNNPLVWRNGRYEIDFDDLDRCLSQARIFLMCNPHNPTGRVFTGEELRRIGELCGKHDVVIVSDEIHSDLIYAPHRHLHIASLSPALAARTVTLTAPSKTFNIPGLYTSAAIIPDPTMRGEFSSQIGRLHVGNVSIFGMAAFEAAYHNGDEWLGQLIEYLQDNRDFVTDFLRRELPAVRFAIPEGTYLMWFDFSQWGLDHKELTRFLADGARVGFNNGFEFGKEGLGHARMNLGTSRAVIERALGQLRDAALKAGF